MKLRLCVVMVLIAMVMCDENDDDDDDYDDDDEDDHSPRSTQQGQRHFGFGGQGFGDNMPVGDGGLGSVNSGFEGVTPGFEGVNPGFEGVNSGFEGIISGFEGVNSGVEGVNSGFEGVNSGFEGVTPGSKEASINICPHWCITLDGDIYCCDIVTVPPPNSTAKPGHCPPARPDCQPLTIQPIVCSKDEDCDDVNKCCFDRCLEKRVCKLPLGMGR